MGNERRERINKIKRALPAVIAVLIIVPGILCIILGIKLYTTNERLKEALELIDSQGKSLTMREMSENPSVYEVGEGGVIVEEKASDSALSVFDHKTLTAKEDVPETEPYYIYLTFDDGPSVNTDRILTILREYDVKATFFVIGKDDDESRMMYEQIVRAGHTLGMHSYSHRYSSLYASDESFSDDLSRIKGLISDAAGYDAHYYRFPGGSSTSLAGRTAMRGFIDILHKNGIEYIDWNVDSKDAAGAVHDADRIVGNVFNDFGKYHTNVVLLHDGAGHDATVEALPLIIERARNMGAILLPITEETVPIQHLGDGR